MVTDSSLLYELEKLDLEVGMENEDSANEDADSDGDLIEQGTPESSDTDPAQDVDKQNDADTVPQKASLWASHPCSSPYFTGNRDVQHQCKKLRPVLDIDKPSSLSKDIGDTPLTNPQVLPTELESAVQQILQKMRKSVGDQPVTESGLEHAPRWIIDKAIQKEKENFFRKKAYEEVNIRDLPRNANLISSHHFFQIKMDGSPDRLKLRCRLVPYGNKDKDKDSIRKDSATAQFPVIRALLSAAANFGFRLGTIDISGAYLQAGKLNREVYLTVEYWMEQIYGTETVIGFVQLFVVRKLGTKVVLIIAKVVDDFLIAGTVEEIVKFHNQIAKRFKVGRFICDKDLVFNGLTIHQEPDGSISTSMDDYFSKISSINIDRLRRKQQDDECSSEERHAFLALAGQLNWLGHGVLPQAAYSASLLQQWTADLKVRHLVEANKALHELRKLKPLLHYDTIDADEISSSDASILAFTDASPGKSSYGQTGYLAGIHIPKSQKYHLIDWHSSKQGRVSYSSIGAEIIAAAESAGRASLLNFGLQDLFRFKQPLPLVLTTDSNGIFSTITTLHEGKDYRLRPTVARLLDSFESNEISVMQWIPGKDNLADALTKRNYAMFRLLNQVANTGILSYNFFKNATQKLSHPGESS